MSTTEHLHLSGILSNKIQENLLAIEKYLNFTA